MDISFDHWVGHLTLQINRSPAIALRNRVARFGFAAVLTLVQGFKTGISAATSESIWLLVSPWCLVIVLDAYFLISFA